LCLWCRAMDVYADVAKDVGPKKARLEEMNAQLAKANADLSEKQGQLKAVQDRVKQLQELCDSTLAEKNRLQAESDTTAARLVRAEKLTSGLNSEGMRWKDTIVALTEEKINLIGDCFLSCACVSYYGGFTGIYRDMLVSQWLQLAGDLSIPASEIFSLTNTLGSPVTIREWQNQGLPTDSVSVNNGILVDRCRRWPLMIDPQMQANKWIRKKEEANNLQITTMRDPNLLRTLENCIRVGRSLLIEDLQEQIEPALEPVLQKATFKNGARVLIRLGDSDVDYDANFKLIMTTKLPNPHYLPEVCIKVTLINFTVTMEGLESQLLGDVVATERPDIEIRKVQLLLQMAEDKRLLQALEEKILKLLSESEGNILDDEVLINTLSESKLTATAISDRVAEAEITEQEINEARGRYLPVATRGSIIYFVIADLASIDPMYQYSLAYYSFLFNKCITDAEKSPNLETRLENIINYTTLVIYQNICRGLFEKDKLLFSASICFQILRQAHQIHDKEWGVFVRGAGAYDRTKLPSNPYPDNIPQPQWELVYGAELLLTYATHDQVSEHPSSSPEPFKGLCDSLASNYHTLWADWLESADILNAPLPAPFANESTVNLFQRLILVKALREDKLQSAIASFVSTKIGPKFAESPNASMEDIYRDLDNKVRVPLTLLLTLVDPLYLCLVHWCRSHRDITSFCS
jgi:dynein heavy chain, axonemal